MSRSIGALVVLSVVLASVAACGGGGLPAVSATPGTEPPPASVAATGTLTPSATAGASATDTSASPAPTSTPAEVTAAPDTPSPGPTPPPTEPPTAPPTPASTPEPTPEPPPPTPTPSPTPTPGLSCTGTASQLTTMRRLAAAVPWDVYCGVLPSDWRLLTLATDLGRVANPSVFVQYNRTDGAFFQMVQGDVCMMAGAGCRPIGTRIGQVRVGGRAGLLYRVGSLHMVWVGRPGEYPSWAFNGSEELSEAEFKKILARIREVPE